MPSTRRARRPFGRPRRSCSRRRRLCGRQTAGSDSNKTDDDIRTVAPDGTVHPPSNIEGYKITFTKAGKYEYICTVHDNMKGEVDVG